MVTATITVKNGIHYAVIDYPLATGLYCKWTDTRQNDFATAAATLEMKMSLHEVLGKFLYQKSLCGLVEKSIENYADFVDMFFWADCMRDVSQIKDITLDKLDLYTASLYRKNLSKGTIGSYLRHIKIFVRWLEEEEYIEQKISRKVKIPRQPKKNVHIYTENEIHAILEAVNHINIEWLRLRNTALIALMIDSGLRRHELTQIKLKDFGKNFTVLNVHGKGDKERFVPIGQTTRRLIEQYIAAQPFELNKWDYLFMNKGGEPITDNTLKQMMYNLSAQLDFSLSAHKLRHNFATNYCIDQLRRFDRVDIYQLMTLMGHEDIATTQRYLHLANQVVASERNISHLDKIFKGA